MSLVFSQPVSDIRFTVTLPTGGHVRFVSDCESLEAKYDLDTINYNITSDYYEFKENISSLSNVWNDSRRDITVIGSGEMNHINIIYYINNSDSDSNDSNNTNSLLLSNIDFKLYHCDYVVTYLNHESQYSAFMERSGWVRYGTVYEWERLERESHDPWINISTVSESGQFMQNNILFETSIETEYDNENNIFNNDSKIVVIDDSTQNKYKIDPRKILQELYKSSLPADYIQNCIGRLYSLNLDQLDFLQYSNNYPLYFMGIIRNNNFIPYNNINNVVAFTENTNNLLDWSLAKNPWDEISVNSTLVKCKTSAQNGAYITDFSIFNKFDEFNKFNEFNGLSLSGDLFGNDSISVTIEFSEPVSDINFFISGLSGQNNFNVEQNIEVVTSSEVMITGSYLDSAICIENINITENDDIFNLSTNHVKNSSFQSSDLQTEVNIKGPLSKINIKFSATIQSGQAYIGKFNISNISFSNGCRIGYEISPGCHIEELAEILWKLGWIKPDAAGPYNWQFINAQGLETDTYQLQFISHDIIVVDTKSVPHIVPLFQRSALENCKLLAVSPNGDLSQVDYNYLYLGYENLDRINNRGANCYPMCGPIMQYSWSDRDCREFGWPGNSDTNEPGIVIRNRVINNYPFERSLICIVYQVTVRNTSPGNSNLRLDNYQIYHTFSGPGTVCSKKVVLLKTNIKSITSINNNVNKIEIVEGFNLNPGQFVCYSVTYYVRDWQKYPTKGDDGIYCYSSTASIFTNNVIDSQVYHYDGDYDTNVLTV